MPTADGADYHQTLLADDGDLERAGSGYELRGMFLTPPAHAPVRPSCMPRRRAWKCAAVAMAVFVGLYLVVLPVSVSVIVAQSPLSIVDLKMLGLPHKVPSSPDQSIRVSSTMLLSKSLPHGVYLGTHKLYLTYKQDQLGAIVPDSDLQTSATGRVTFNSSLVVGSYAGFHLLGQDLVQQPNITMHMQAWASVFVPLFKSSSVALPIPFVYISKDVTIKACDGLREIHLEIFDLADVPGPANDVRLHIRVLVGNPSGVAVADLGHVDFNVFFQGSFVTKLETDGVMRLQGGNNLLIANGLFRPADANKTSYLIHDFITGTEVVLDTIAPMKKASDVPLFSDFLGGLTLKARLHGYSTGVMVSGIMDFSPLKTIADLLKYGRVDVDGQMRLYNPFQALIEVHHVDFVITYNGVEISSCISDLVVPIPGNTSAYTPKMVMTLDTKGNEKNLKAIIEAVTKTLQHGHVLFGLKGSFKFKLGNYEFNPPYEQAQNIVGCTFLDRAPCDDAKPPSGPPHIDALATNEDGLVML